MEEHEEPQGPMEHGEEMALTDECHHYESWQEMPLEISKYWRQRYDLFSLYDSGIMLTNAAWYGVTAEPIAVQIAAELAAKTSNPSSTAARPRRKVVIDLFAGAGGNTIALARQRHWDLVIGIEIDGATLACAQHNAALYSSPSDDDDDDDDNKLTDIKWVHGDCIEYLQMLANYDLDDNDIQLFASPPWGGPMYSGADVLDLDAMAPYGVSELHAAMRRWPHALFLPRNGDLNQLAALVPEGAAEKLDVVQYCVNGSCKGMVAYFPADAE